MAIIRQADGIHDQIEKSARKYRSTDELVIRKALDAWGRTRWPEARQVHELVVGDGASRADMAFVCPADLVAVEIKSAMDYGDRLFWQATMFSLAAPEVWICCDERHLRDVEIVRHLMPHLGLIEAKVVNDQAELIGLHPAQRRVPHPRMLLGLLWVAELTAEAERHHLIQGKGRWTSAKLIALLLEKLSPDEMLSAVCRQLRGRQAFWRADPPVVPEQS